MSDGFSDENKKFLSQWFSDDELQKMSAKEAKFFSEQFLKCLGNMMDPNWVTSEKQFQVSRQHILDISVQALKKLRYRNGLIDLLAVM